MNAIQNSDWDNEAGLKNASVIDGDRGLSYVTVMDPSKGEDERCAEILHGLNNVPASVLLTAQMLGWKVVQTISS